VTGPVAYLTWERGQGQEVPELLSNAMKAQERLLWCATLPSGRLTPRRLWGATFFLGLTVLFVLSAPWGQNMAEYCVKSTSSRCEMVFLLAWPSVVFCVWFTAYLLLLAWKSHVAPWQDLYGVSTERALRIEGNRPGKVHSVSLDRKSARIDWFGDVRFDKSRTGLAFPGLDDRDARRAVYWANEGRLQTVTPGEAAS
jgi:hypothetical protein